MPKSLSLLDGRIKRAEDRLTQNTQERERLALKLRKLKDARDKLATNELSRALAENALSLDDVLEMIQKQKGILPSENENPA